ncbi:hypothetical protein HMPREF9138_02387 [Prevotella histicola F0411]|uniref:Uncharacterized protein n=1 Tax=Prevotella histicola F0411 TaxID=857291 RepID=G6AJW0_9BACT|nr:hypothetical protein HMPREF9138_02387 [Prevotella histicola F0411]
MRQCYCGNEMRGRLFPFLFENISANQSSDWESSQNGGLQLGKLRLASKEPEYAVFLSCLYSLRQSCPARLGEMNTTARILRIAIQP